MRATDASRPHSGPHVFSIDNFLGRLLFVDVVDARVGDGHFTFQYYCADYQNASTTIRDSAAISLVDYDGYEFIHTSYSHLASSIQADDLVHPGHLLIAQAELVCVQVLHLHHCLCRSPMQRRGLQQRALHLQ
jgi:hypothetical protein